MPAQSQLFPTLPPPAPPPATLGLPPSTLAPGSPLTAPPAPLSIQDMIRQEAEKAGIPWQLALAVAEQESSFNPKALGPPLPSGARAIGTFQILPETAKMFGGDPNDPHDNIVIGTKYLRQLLDRYQGDPAKALATYGGVVRDTTYVPGVLAKMQKYGGPPAAAPPAPEGFWGSLANSLDPHERLGRQNLVGTAGAIGGGILGAIAGGAGGGAAGIETGPGAIATGGAGAIWGGRIGSAVGAAAGGGLEQALIEETGIGDWLSKHLPLGTQDEPTPPPDPTSTYTSRVAGAAVNQGVTDVAGQVIAVPFRIVAKRILQTPIGRAAAEKLAAAHAAAAEAFQGTRTYLGQQVRAARATAADAMAQLQADIAQRMENLRIIQRTTTIQPARAARLAVQDAAREGEARLAASHDVGIDAARARAAAAVKGATTTRDEALADLAASHESTLAAAAPSASAAGRGVADVFEGAAQASRRSLGAAVDEAAASGPFKDIRALKAEAERIDKEDLLPRTFPNQKAQAVVEAIKNESPVVSFQRLHELKQELQDSLRGVYDKASRSQMEGVVLHLTKQIRETLSGYAPYDLATKAYADVVPRYTSQLAKTIRRAARTSPEDIAQMISADKPTQARFLTDLMTEAAAEGGNAAGGRQALENVQDVWFYKNVLEGGLEGLGDRIAKLKRNPEFLRNFLGDSRAKALLTRAEELAQEYPKMVLLHEGRIAAAKEAGEAGVTAATKGKEAALASHKQVSTADIRRATEGVTSAVETTRATTAQARAVNAGERTRLRQEHRGLIEDAQRELEAAPRGELDAVTAAIHRLNASTLGSKNLRTPVQVGADLIGAMRPTSVFSGLSRMRLLLGASDADIARYVTYSKLPVRTLAHVFITGPELPLAASHAVKASQILAPLSGQSGELSVTIQADDKDKKKGGVPPPPPRQ